MTIGKRESQRLARRSQIIAVAREHFFEHGFDGTVMSAIATKLGGSKGTLWNYFPSKEALFAAVVEDTAASVREAIDFSGRGDTPIEKLTSLCRTIIDRMTAPLILQMYRLVSPLAERRPEIGRIFFERGPMRTQQMIADYLRNNFGGLLHVTDYVEAGKDLVALAAGVMHFEGIWGISGPPSAKAKQLQARRAAVLFLRAWARDPDKLVPLAEFEAIEREPSPT